MFRLLRTLGGVALWIGAGLGVVAGAAVATADEVDYEVAVATEEGAVVEAGVVTEDEATIVDVVAVPEEALRLDGRGNRIGHGFGICARVTGADRHLHPYGRQRGGRHHR